MRRGSQGGFTLTELLIAVAIIATLAAIAVPNFLASRMAAHESAAIATLRTLATAQAQAQGACRIDVDADAIGEFGTFVELVGEAGVRTRRVDSEPAGADFSTQASAINTPPLTASMMDYMEASGYLVKGGYAFMVFLPDTSDPAVGVHEEITLSTSASRKRRKAVESVILRGGSQTVGIDLSETVWCAYAQPQTFKTTGTRAFFMNQAGDVLQCENTTAKHQGTSTAIAGESAFLGAGITSPLAIGTMGHDGEVWKITN